MSKELRKTQGSGWHRCACRFEHDTEKVLKRCRYHADESERIRKATLDKVENTVNDLDMKCWSEQAMVVRAINKLRGESDG